MLDGRLTAQLLAATLALLLAFGAGWAVRDKSATVAVLACEQRAKDLEAQRQALATVEEARQSAAVQKVDDEAKPIARARADHRRAADVAGAGLRVSAQALARDPAPAEPPGQCEAARRTSALFADLLAAVEEEGRRMAATADERGDAGTACQQSWEALRAPYPQE